MLGLEVPASHASRVCEEAEAAGLRVLGVQSGVLVLADGPPRALAAVRRRALADWRCVSRVFWLPHACHEAEWLAASPAVRALHGRGPVRLEAFPAPLLNPVGELLWASGLDMAPGKAADAVVQAVYCPELSPLLLFGVRERDADGAPRGAAEVPCRAFYKLQQALRRAPRPPPRACAALDVGAAPGGWTEYLLSHWGAASVVAVDPGRLSCPPSPRLTHVAALAEQALPEITARGPYDLLVCDANIHVNEATALVRLLAPLLRPGALVVLTLKLHTKTQTGCAQAAERVVAALRGVLEAVHVYWLLSNTQHERTLVGSVRRV